MLLLGISASYLQNFCFCGEKSRSGSFAWFNDNRHYLICILVEYRRNVILFCVSCGSNTFILNSFTLTPGIIKLKNNFTIGHCRSFHLPDKQSRTHQLTVPEQSIKVMVIPPPPKLTSWHPPPPKPPSPLSPGSHSPVELGLKMASCMQTKLWQPT